MQKLTPDQWMGIIRQALTFIGGFLVTQGSVSSTIVEQIIGGVMAILGLVWSVKSKSTDVNGKPKGDPVVKLFRNS